MGLLEQIAETALDDDYYVYRGSARPATRTVLALVLAGLGLLAAPAALSARQQSSAADLERRTLIDDVRDQQTAQGRSQAILDQLHRDVETLQRDRGIESTDTADLAAVTGAAAVAGPGVRIRVDNGPGEDGVVTDTDLQLLVNGLWYAGAEAVSLDGERVGSLTSIRKAGDAITVNYRSIRPPYDVLAVGDEKSMTSNFDQSPVGQYWETRHRRARIDYVMTSSPMIEMTSVPARRLTIKHAEVLSERGAQ